MDKEKLNDLWKMNLDTNEWTEIKYKKNQVNDFSDQYPLERSGHSCDVIGHYMVIFGGLFELTKELNDMYVFDLKNQNWIKIFDPVENPASPMKFGFNSNRDQSQRDYGTSDRDRNLIKPIIQDSPYVINEESQSNQDSAARAKSQRAEFTKENKQNNQQASVGTEQTLRTDQTERELYNIGNLPTKQVNTTGGTNRNGSLA